MRKVASTPSSGFDRPIRPYSAIPSRPPTITAITTIAVHSTSGARIPRVRRRSPPGVWLRPTTAWATSTSEPPCCGWVAAAAHCCGDVVARYVLLLGAGPDHEAPGDDPACRPACEPAETAVQLVAELRSALLQERVDHEQPEGGGERGGHEREHD